MTIRKMLAGAVVAMGLAMMTGVACAAGPAMAQQKQTEIAPASAANSPETGATFTDAELIPLTVHQAWLKSGRNEDVFFDMVTQLAELSAQNRGLELPQSKAAGQRVGEMIKTMAKQDTGQLLYAVVDAAVRKVGKPMTAAAAAQ
jgi:hypothetical protein